MRKGSAGPASLGTVVLFWGLLAGTTAQARMPVLFPWWALTQTGCADNRLAHECPTVSFVPSGRPGVTPGNYNDVEVAELVERCSPAVIGRDWMDLDDPEIPLECEDMLLEELPLSVDLDRPDTEEKRIARSSLARALHALLFMPLADPGGLFGSADPMDYCPAIYSDFLGAVPLADGEVIELGALAPEDHFSAGGRHLAQFILERAALFRYLGTDHEKYDPESGTIASESKGRITLHLNFTGQENPLILASTLVHESRHTWQGFGNGGPHVECPPNEDGEIESICDPTPFGSYGSGVSYLDAALRAGIRTLDADGKPLFSMRFLADTYEHACDRYNDRILEKSGPLEALFEEFGCDPSEEELLEALTAFYGVPRDELLVRGKPMGPLRPDLLDTIQEGTWGPRLGGWRRR